MFETKAENTVLHHFKNMYNILSQIISLTYNWSLL